MKSCNGCKPPKRHPGCHAHCPDYHTDKIMDIVKKAASEKEAKVRNDIYNNRAKKVNKAKRNRIRSK